jgi:hypothetical protein
VSKSADVDANPGVRAGETALRLGLGELTIDLLPSAEETAVQATVSNGQLGTGPATGTVDLSTIGFLVVAADLARQVRSIDTAAWPRVSN